MQISQNVTYWLNVEEGSGCERRHKESFFASQGGVGFRFYLGGHQGQTIFTHCGFNFSCGSVLFLVEYLRI